MRAPKDSKSPQKEHPPVLKVKRRKCPKRRTHSYQRVTSFPRLCHQISSLHLHKRKHSTDSESLSSHQIRVWCIWQIQIPMDPYYYLVSHTHNSREKELILWFRHLPNTKKSIVGFYATPPTHAEWTWLFTSTSPCPYFRHILHSNWNLHRKLHTQPGKADNVAAASAHKHQALSCCHLVTLHLKLQSL